MNPSNEPLAVDADVSPAEAEFLKVAKLSMMAKYVDCSAIQVWTPAEWSANLSAAARAWDLDGRPPAPLLNRCACGRVISKNKLACMGCQR